MKPKRDIHQEITSDIIKRIEDGTGRMQMPWHSDVPLWMPKNIHSGNAYRGINVLNLWLTAEFCGFASNVWGTYKQWQANDCQVRKGEKSSTIIFYKEFKVSPDPNQPNDDGRRFVARASSTFNSSQVDGYTAENDTSIQLSPIERITGVDQFVTATGATINHGGSRAFYTPSTDQITMPDDWRFIDTNTPRNENYYSILLHELTHWTGHKKRLDRSFKSRTKTAKEAYAFEELVAELGAAFSCASLGLSNKSRGDHAGYIAKYLQLLKNDKRAIFHAASKAAQATDFLRDLQPKQEKLAA